MTRLFLRHTAWALLWLPAMGGCNCDDALNQEPVPDAVLALGSNLTPPLPYLTVAMPAAVIASPVEVTLELRNKGQAVLDVSNVILGRDETLCPTPSAAFIIADPVASGGKRAFTLAEGESRNLRVRFTAQSGAPECVLLTVSSNDPDSPALKALLTGRGDAPRLCAAETTLDFGELEVGQTGDDVVTLTSCGTRAVELTGISTNSFFPPFSADNVVLPLTLEPQGTLEIPVHFHPLEGGIWNVSSGKAGILTITANGGEIYQITLMGRSRLPPSCVVEVSPPALNFGVVVDMAPQMQDVVISNRGERDCTLQNIELTPAGGVFAAALVTASPGATLAPQQSTLARVTMTPGSNMGVFNATLGVLTSDAVTPRVDVPIEVNLPGEQPCVLQIDPATVNFGAVPLGTLRTRIVTLRNLANDSCFVTGVSLETGSSPAFVNTASNFTFIAAGAERTISVSFRPMQTGTANGRLRVRASDSLIGGSTVDYFAQLTGRTGTSGICVEPRHLDFGAVTAPGTMDFTISACGAQSVTVSALEWTAPDAEFSLASAVTLPFTLMPGSAQVVTVRYSPADQDGDTAAITVRSDDGVNPAVVVDMTGGPEVVPPAAGRYLYYWQIPTGVQGGDVMKFPLQGNTTPTPFWGPRTGKQCAGCHSVSPDGKYVAVLELASMRFVEADTGAELILGDRFADPQYFSWRPDVESNPPYQFAYGTGTIIKVAALFDGFIRDLQGANDPSFLQTMPTWGSNGKIAFVKGQGSGGMGGGAGATGFSGPTDIMIVDETGGVPTALPGASANGMGNYYPAFSPNGQWIAFTQSASASTTVAALDAQVRLKRADGTGTVLELFNLNGSDGATSYPTWAVDGTYLSFSSTRSGGAGDWDIYVAPVDPVTGADGAAQNLEDLNTRDFEHAAQWSP